MANPYITAGPLNRVRTHIVIPNMPTLNVTPENMGKSFASIEFEGDWTTQIETGTGVVNSPEPYVMATISCGLLRSSALAAAWLFQGLGTTIMGDVTIYPDTSVFPPIVLNSVAIRQLQPGRFDGTDPVVALTLRGTMNINQNLWAFTI